MPSIRSGLCSIALVSLLSAFSLAAAKADTDWYDCYNFGVHWRFSGDMWREGFHDKPLLRPNAVREGCGAYYRGPQAFYGLPANESDAVISGRRRAPALTPRHIAACAARYRTYDARTDTFVGRHGRVYRCKL